MEPEWPETAYIAIMFIKTKKMQMVLPIDPIFATANQAKLGVERNEKLLKRKTGASIYGMVIMEMKLRKKIPLKKTYWQGEMQKRNNQREVMRFNEFMGNPKMYQFLILPRRYDDNLKEWVNCVARPFFISDDDTEIENFMMTSEDSVDEKATTAATYTQVRSWGMNWETKKIKEVEDTVTKISEEMGN